MHEHHRHPAHGTAFFSAASTGRGTVFMIFFMDRHDMEGPRAVELPML
jgi:hypothetical protein